MFVRIGRFCVRHRRSVLLAWALVLLAGIGLGSQVFAHLKEANGSSRAESVRGFQLVDDASRHGPGLVAVVDGAPVDDPATRRAVTAAARQVSRVDGVTGVVTAYDVPDPRLRAEDGRASLMVISTTKTTDMMRSNQIPTGVRAAVSGAVPGATVTVGGELAVMHEQPGDNAGIASNVRSARTGTGRRSPSTRTSRLPSRRSSIATTSRQCRS